MRTVEEHLAAVLAAVRPTEVVSLPVTAALGLVTAQDVSARVDLPGFDNSAMDGYAVRAADVAGASAGEPVRLAIVAEVAAGAFADVAVAPGQAVRIMTGAMMPAGADAVVMVEDTSEPEPGVVEVRASVPAGRSVRARGEDVVADSVVLPAGSVLTAQRIGLLAATGHAEVLVHRRPVVAVLSTGSELVPPGRPLESGHIHDSNSYLLAAALAGCGVEVRRHDPVADSGPDLRAALAELSTSVDAVVTSGGVSMGLYDVVKDAFGVTGAAGHGSGEVGTIDFVQVAMQPGKPQGLGRLGARGIPLFALPGNPVSAYVSFEVFVRPALAAMSGRSPTGRGLRGTVSTTLRSPRGRRQIARAVARHTAAGWVADPVWGQASHFVADLARANSFVVVPEDVTELHAGDEVEIWLLDGSDWGAAGDLALAVDPVESEGSAR